MQNILSALPSFFSESGNSPNPEQQKIEKLPTFAANQQFIGVNLFYTELI